MSIKTVTKCDGCGKIIERISECYKLVLKTNRFWDGVEMDYNLEQLDFCPICAREIKRSLERIAKSLEQKGKMMKEEK